MAYAVAAGGRRMPSPSVTASGSPDRLLCPDPVRHVSVIRPIEHVAASRGNLPICSNMWFILVCVVLLTGQDDISERNTGR